MRKALIMILGFVLSGCANAENASETAALFNQLALGVTSGLVGSGKLSPTAAVTASTALTGAYVISQSRRRHTPPAQKTASAVGTTDYGYPDTPACHRFLDAARTSSSKRQIIVLYHSCLNSAPNHPRSRANRCGKGKYRYTTFSGTHCGL